MGEPLRGFKVCDNNGMKWRLVFASRYDGVSVTSRARTYDMLQGKSNLAP